MKINNHEAQQDLLSLPIANHRYNQRPQAKFTQFNAVYRSLPANIDFPLFLPTLSFQRTQSSCRIWESGIAVLLRNVHEQTRKINHHEVLQDILSLPIANQMYNQRPQAKFTQFSAINWSIWPSVDCQSPTPADASFNSTNSTVTPASLIEMANNVQQHEAALNSQENKMMAQFQEVLSLIQSANIVQSITHVSTSKNNNKRNQKWQIFG